MKIKIKDKSFNTTHYGYLEAEKEYEVSKEFANYCVKRMKSAEYVEVKHTVKKKVKAK